MRRWIHIILAVVLCLASASCSKALYGIGQADVLQATKVAPGIVRASEVPSLFAAMGVQYHTVSSINWPDKYPYLPRFEVAIAHNGQNILIHYRVTDKTATGTIENDMGRVYTESCCEIFLWDNSLQQYYNIEANCIGSILMQCGASRGGKRDRATAETLALIDRWSSLGRKSVGTIEHEISWEMALVIPTKALWKTHVTELDGKRFKANVYYCSETGNEHHYVSMFPINTPSPDFHRPEFFRPLNFTR